MRCSSVVYYSWMDGWMDVNEVKVELKLALYELLKAIGHV